MSFHGPKGKVARALGHSVSQKTAKALDRRNFPPGQHGLNRKKAASVYKQQLMEKQRLRFTYNISEQDMRRAYERASKFHGSTGDALLQVLETRLDAMIFRMGFARTMFAARQYVAHGHFMVNGRRCFIPSRLLRAGDVVAVRDRSKSHAQIVEAIGSAPDAPSYLEVDKTKMEGKLVAIPPRDQIPVKLTEQLVVEYYNR
ncbi:MAG TPA: 30S ribosomal protein S4 [Fibrobacteraceae bacterium]|nr:30S ribosomal protein S4 [Fibrobacteraceae bacterium]